MSVNVNVKNRSIIYVRQDFPHRYKATNQCHPHKTTLSPIQKITYMLIWLYIS